MSWLNNQDIPVGRPGIERLKTLNNQDLHGLGKFQWVYKEINTHEEIGLWYINKINGRETADWFYETDTEDEIQEKLRSIKAEEELWNKLPKYK